MGFLLYGVLNDADLLLYDRVVECVEQPTVQGLGIDTVVHPCVANMFVIQYWSELLCDDTVEGVIDKLAVIVGELLDWEQFGILWPVGDLFHTLTL